MKTIGHRQPAKGSIKNADHLQRLAIALRGDKPFHPRGVFKFKTYAEKEAWTKKLLAR